MLIGIYIISFYLFRLDLDTWINLIYLSWILKPKLCQTDPVNFMEIMCSTLCQHLFAIHLHYNLCMHYGLLFFGRFSVTFPEPCCLKKRTTSSKRRSTSTASRSFSCFSKAKYFQVVWRTSEALTSCDFPRAKRVV